MKVAAIIGVLFVVTGIIIIGVIAVAMFGVMSHDADDISDVFTGSNLIVVGIMVGIPFGACLLPGYFLLKSANKKP